MGGISDQSHVRILGTGVGWEDGSEDRVLSILRAAQDRSSASDELAAEIDDWPTRYHFSRLRSKLLLPLRMTPGTRVLDLGGGSGPLSRKLGELGADVTLVDGSPARAQAAATRCEGLDNVSVALGTIFELDDGTKRFDLILAVGLLEYAPSNPGGVDALLQKAVSLLEPAGALAVSIENAIGLKYLLGYAEDHVGLPWVGLEGYPGVDSVRTYSRPELASILTAAGLAEQAWFYPFPDYKLPTVILSDAAYTIAGPEVVDAIIPKPCSSDASPPALLCDSRAAHRTMLGAGLGRDIANSFLVVGARTSAALAELVDSETLAWLPGADRQARFMRDRRLVSQSSSLAIVDDTASPESVEDGWLIQRRFPMIPYVTGDPLDRLIVDAVAVGDGNRTRELLTLWVATVRESAVPAPSASDADAGASPFYAEPGSPAIPGNYLDSQPANFIHRDGKLERIDAEWEARGLVDFELVCIRGLFYLTQDVLQRGIANAPFDADGIASMVKWLAKAAGLASCDRALERLPAAEAELQTLVLGLSRDGARAHIDEVLRSSARLVQKQSLPFTVLHRELEAATVEKRQIAEDFSLAEGEIRRAHDELTVAKGELAGTRNALTVAEGDLIAARNDLLESWEQIKAMRNTVSWRITAPLRQVRRVFRGR